MLSDTLGAADLVDMAVGATGWDLLAITVATGKFKRLEYLRSIVEIRNSTLVDGVVTTTQLSSTTSTSMRIISLSSAILICLSSRLISYNNDTTNNYNNQTDNNDYNNYSNQTDSFQYETNNDAGGGYDYGSGTDNYSGGGNRNDFASLPIR